jgi:hypothetical protein
MSTFPGSPRLLKGAILGLDPINPLASVIIFQYNPDTLTRTLRPKAAAADGDRSEALRLKGPPEETIKVDVEIDATDQLETGNPMALALGIYPSLAALEMLIYPKSALAIANEVLAAVGVVEIIPPQAPLTLFIWGAKRVVPVRLTDLTITEEAFDPTLNPIRAKASLGMRVLTYDDLGMLTPGGAISMAHQVQKEAMATAGSVAGLAAAGSFASNFITSIGS